MDTTTPGGVMRGYCAMGKNRSAIPPIKVMTTESTVAKMGRSMKKREIMSAGRSLFGLVGRRRFPACLTADRWHGCLLRLDQHAGTGLLQAPNDDPVLR